MAVFEAGAAPLETAPFPDPAGGGGRGGILSAGIATFDGDPQPLKQTRDKTENKNNSRI
ncbi:MAG TPA: hypothetical protein VM260_12895 [Pirellula sp.]|nr:hypothetical protein [Pirellula sp.]